MHFSCRIARCARSRNPPVDVDIIAYLKAAAALDPTSDLTARLGDSFARGHKEASGGIVPVAEFEALMALMGVGEKPDGTSATSSAAAAAAAAGGSKGTGPGTKTGPGPVQKNNLLNYFGKG